MLIPSEAVREVYPRPFAWLLVLLTILGVRWPVEAHLPFHGMPSVCLFAYVYVHVCVCVRICVCVCVSIPPFRQDASFLGSGAHPVAV